MSNTDSATERGELTREEARELIYRAFFAVVAMCRSRRLSIAEFFEEKIGARIEDRDDALDADPDLTRSDVAYAITDAFRVRGFYIRHFSEAWLAAHKDKTWVALIEHMANANLQETERL